MHHLTVEDAAAASLPCAGGLLASTRALMTCWAVPEPDAQIDAAQQRALMASKIASNLFLLRQHPDLPGGLRLVVTRLHARWCDIAPAGHEGTQPTEPPVVACAVGAVH